MYRRRPDAITVKYLNKWKELNIQGMIFNTTDGNIPLERTVQYPWILLDKEIPHMESEVPTFNFACSYFDQLPLEMIEFILDYVDYAGVLSLMRTCMFWRTHLKNESAWYRLIERGNINTIIKEHKPNTFPLHASSIPEAIAKIARYSKGFSEQISDRPLVFSSISIDELMALLQPDKPCFLIYRHLGVSYFVLWCPDCVGVKFKMMTASFAHEVSTQLDCEVKLQMTDEGEAIAVMETIRAGQIPNSE